MEKFIPYEKLSKKKQRELDAKRREVWTISPITRKPDNPKAYKRKKTQRKDVDDPFSVFFVSLYDFFLSGSHAHHMPVFSSNIAQLLTVSTAC